MDRPTDQILTVAQMRAAEQLLIDAGESVESLMECAGTGAAQWVWRMAGGRPVTVLCGPGNNGGDGYVIARELYQRGLTVAVVAPMEPTTKAAIAARASYRGPFVEHAAGSVLVDCLFGSGLTRALSNDLAGLLGRLAQAHPYRIAIDLPSGVESDSGAPLGEGLPDYQLTLALGAWKFAHWLMPSASQMGALRLVEIGIAPAADAAHCLGQPVLSPPARDAHKYSRGLLAVISGAMPGAAMLAARAAMHGGAGYVKVMAKARPDGVPDDLVVESGRLDVTLQDARIAAVLIGPGLGRDAAAKERLSATLARDLPSVVDADALHLLTTADLAAREAPLVVTPHAGELRQLCEAFAIRADNRLAQAKALAEAAGTVVVAKGPATAIASPGGDLWLAPPAPSWLSTAGTGDVLAGIIASRLATGVPAERAAQDGVWLHGEAARLAGPAFSSSGLAQCVAGAYAACL